MTVVSLLLAVLLTDAKSPPDAAEDEVRTAVDRWIKQLDASALADRSRAERELLDLGPRILPLLPPKELIRGVSTREAVQRIRFQLQRRLAQESARPSRVTVSGEYRLDDLLAEITSQTANPVQLAEDIPASAKMARAWTLDDLTFWDTIDEICDAAHLAPTSHPENDVLLLAAAPANQRQPVICRTGVLRAVIREASRQPVAGDPTRMLIRLQGELAFEPRLRPLFVHFKAGDFSAADPDGKPIENWNPQARYELPMAGASRRTHLIWDFVAPANAVPKSLTMKGRLLVQLAAATEPIRFDELATNKEILRRRGGVSVRLHQTEFAEAESATRSAKVKITVSYDAGGPAFESHRTWVYHNSAWIEQGKRRFPFTDFDTLQQTDGSVQLEYRFKNLPHGDGLKFVYEAPTLLLDVPFDVEFEEVEITVK